MTHQTLTPKDLREIRLGDFTAEDIFPTILDETCLSAKTRIEDEVSKYGGGFSVTGLPGLSMQTFNKASRVFNFVIRDKVGKDKIEDEIEDLLNYAIYLKVYYTMIKVKQDGK